MRTFKQFLTEAMKMVADLKAHGMFIVFRPDAPDIENSLIDPAPKVLFQLCQGNSKTPHYAKFLGETELEMPQIDGKPYYDIGVYAVHSHAPHGYGPILYDCAAEYASMHGMGIVSAQGLGAIMKSKGHPYERGETSGDAAGVWKGYGKRQDVRRGYGGPGYDPNQHALTSPVRKRVQTLYDLTREGLIVDPSGRAIDFTRYG